MSDKERLQLKMKVFFNIATIEDIARFLLFYATDEERNLYYELRK